MRYIKDYNMQCLTDRLYSLDALAEIASVSNGSDVIRESILAKIEKRRQIEKSYYSETELPDGSVRIRHPAIGVVELDHSAFPEPTQLFGNPCKSLVAYTFTISRADAILAPDGLVRYEPYELVGKFVASERSFNMMLCGAGRLEMPVNVEYVIGYKVEESIPSVMVNQGRTIASWLPGQVHAMGASINRIVGNLEAAKEKGGKLGKKDFELLVSSATSFAPSFIRNTSYRVSCVAEYAQEVNTARRMELEALICLRKKKESK